MMTDEYGSELAEILSTIAICPSPNTHLYNVGYDIIEMVNAYSSDGLDFLCKGDLVNAHAAFTYGFGWLDAGIVLGVLSGRKGKVTLPFFYEVIDANLGEHLKEKTTRYCGMLKLAQNALEIGPDIESALYVAAEEVLSFGSIYYSHGRAYLEQKAHMNALASFSYGYGWLDAGVRAGLFRIIGRRDLFTV
jgi:hypothetical protein